MPKVKTNQAGVIDHLWFAQFDVLDVSEEMASKMEKMGFLIPQEKQQLSGSVSEKICDLLFEKATVSEISRNEVDGHTTLIYLNYNGFVMRDEGSPIVMMKYGHSSQIHLTMARNFGSPSQLLPESLPGWLEAGDVIFLLSPTFEHWQGANLAG